MRRASVAALLAAALVATVQAQSVYTTSGLTTSAPLSASTTYTPTNVWAPNPTCSAGSNALAQNGGYGGGVYRDDYGSYWEVGCGYDWSGPYMENLASTPPGAVGTSAQGIWACFRGCASRIGCVAFTYTGTQTTTVNSGSGRCYHRFKDLQGNFYYNGTTLNTQAIYAAAYMIQSSPSMICPYYNDTLGYRSSTGLGYYVACGAQNYVGVDINNINTPSLASCVAACEQNTLGNCTAVTWFYQPNAEPANAGPGTGVCYMKKDGTGANRAVFGTYGQVNTLAVAFPSTVTSSTAQVGSSTYDEDVEADPMLGASWVVRDVIASRKQQV